MIPGNQVVTIVTFAGFKGDKQNSESTVTLSIWLIYFDEQLFFVKTS